VKGRNENAEEKKKERLHMHTKVSTHATS